MGNDINKNRIFKGISSQTVVTMVNGALSILTFSMFTRLLTKEDFGYFAALNSILIIFQVFSQAGLGTAVIQKQNCSKEYFSTAFTLSLIISIALALILFLSAGILANAISDETIAIPLRLLSLILIFGSLEGVGRAALMRQLQFLRYGIYQIVSYVVSYAIGIYMAYKGYGLYSLVLASILNSLFVCVCVYVFGVSVPKLLILKKDAKEIFSFGGWLTASLIVHQLTCSLDKLVLGKWLSVSALGSYSRPSTFIGTIADRITGVFDTVLFPVLSSIQDDIPRMKKTYVQSMSLLNIFSLLLAATFFFNAELLIYIFFGNRWLELVPVFRIISLGVVFMVNQRMVDCFFRSLALVRQNFYIRLVSMIIMLLALYIGAKNGIESAAWCVLMANFISIVIKVMYLSFKIRLKFVDIIMPFIKSFKPILPVVLLGTLYSIFFNKDLLINSVIFLFIYSLLIIVEFLCFPSFISENYNSLVGPYILKIKLKIKRR